ncbi:MAG: hypothetical protein PF588_07640, partial [Candidatus Kapabacteria bacterium]|nr:hypothetical protein [Candidatus Kapabacteria bacterium]
NNIILKDSVRIDISEKYQIINKAKNEIYKSVIYDINYSTKKLDKNEYDRIKNMKFYIKSDTTAYQY